MKIFSIESSCDETSCAVLENGRLVLSNIVASQLDKHSLYGGVVPEMASRLHCESIVGVCDQALKIAGFKLAQIDAVAVTFAPGLIGALLVGVNFAKGIAMGIGKPLIPVHHIKGHVAANYITHKKLEPPFLALVASGGHSSIVEVKDYTNFNPVGQTIDDAAGEAFDKAARAMGLPYPGGVYIEKASLGGDPKKYKFPFPKTSNKYDFSFSGLKTAAINLIHNIKQRNGELDISSLAASFQYTVCCILSEKFISAAERYGYKKIVLAGGVAANSLLRDMLEQKAKMLDMDFYYPAPEFCGDNAAMIGCQGFYEFLAGNIAGNELNAVASHKL
ncbi:MAG: tRNA (adenosine(37)-N6)-threonylcarbamoyltransferase complex transferase subunit TsaD [Eubacterium sp.]|jgi:N6-L-threonylcarbamoyladenine synthase|nr:tRNA (adenosine(37)-N6)-threonylcarbamoyltransferase complex transferase subunit TsaD [Eubacterium sp.]